MESVPISGELSCCLARLGEERRAYWASRLASQSLRASVLNSKAHPVQPDLKLLHEVKLLVLRPPQRREVTLLDDVVLACQHVDCACTLKGRLANISEVVEQQVAYCEFSRAQIMLHVVLRICFARCKRARVLMRIVVTIPPCFTPQCPSRSRSTKPTGSSTRDT